MDGQAYVYDAVRTPRGRVRRSGGTLADLTAADLFGQLLTALADRGLPPDRVDDIVAGVSTTTGEQAPDVPRVAVMLAGWPDETPAGTVSRMCCSGLDAIATAAAQVRSGMADLVVAGGAESMSRVPMMSDKPGVAVDPRLAAATGFVTIGVSADYTAVKHGFAREQLDAFGVRSHVRAAAAPAWECIVPVTHQGEVILAADEGARADTTMESMAALPALFGEDPAWATVEERFPGFVRPSEGLHTVGTAPQLCDGASAAVIGSSAVADVLGRAPRARIAGWAHTAVRSPGLDGTIEAARLAMKRAGITTDQLAVAELNESFSVSPLLLIRELGLDEDIVNEHGGAVALGHPLGASGGIILANAIERLERHAANGGGGGYGLLVIPAGLGVSMAVVIEQVAS